MPMHGFIGTLLSDDQQKTNAETSLKKICKVGMFCRRLHSASCTSGSFGLLSQNCKQKIAFVFPQGSAFRHQLHFARKPSI